MKYEVDNIDKYKNIAKSLIENLDGSLMICLSGDLGAGKTTFTQVIGSKLDSNMIIKSPTFTIHNEYDLKNSNNKLHHLDLYRLNSQKEVEELNILGLMKDNNIVVIEWADKFKDYINSLSDNFKIIWVDFSYIDENSRLVVVNTE